MEAETTSTSSTPAAAIALGHGLKFLTEDARAGTREPMDATRLRVLASPPGIMADRLFGLTWTVAMDSVRRFGNSSTLTTRLIMMGTNGTLPSVRQSGFARAVGTTTRLSKPQEDGRMGVRAMVKSFLRVIWFVRR